jgi:hypothetical protein
MLERFKRSSSEDSAPATGATATADPPRSESAAATADDRSAVSDRTATDDHHTAVADGTATDRTTADEHATATDEPRRFTRTHDADHDGVDDRTEGVDDRTAGVDDRTAVRERPAAAPERTGVATTSALATARARQRDEFGGINWGASFFGWLVAVGIAALLTAILAAAGAAIGLIDTADVNSSSNVEQIGVGGGIALLVVLMLAYYAGGYVAGRMSRFDGARQGLGTWAVGLVVTVLLALAAVILGDQYNVLERLNLPSLPVGDQTLATGGIIALAAIVLGTIIAAMAGGKVGERYHRRVDRVGFID